MDLGPVKICQENNGRRADLLFVTSPNQISGSATGFISFLLFVWTNYLIFSKCILYTGAWYPEEELYQKPSEGIGDKMDHFVNVTSDCQQYVNIGFDQIAHGKFLSFSGVSAQEGVSAQGGCLPGGSVCPGECVSQHALG